MKIKVIVAALLASMLFQGAFSDSAFAKTTVSYKKYSVGFMLDDDSCDFGERFNMPDEFSAIFTLKTATRRTKRNSSVSRTIYRTGKFPFQTKLTKIKVTRRGFTASGTYTSGVRGFNEKIKISTGKNTGEATLQMTVIYAGTSCEYSYSGDAMAL